MPLAIDRKDHDKLATGEAITSLPILILNVHSRCNCRCVMCDIWKRTDNVELSPADLEQHRSDLRRLGVRWVILTGGEPLLHSGFVSLCTFLRSENIRITLLTTGILLKIRAHEISDLIDDVIVSLDGPAEIHDRIRGVTGAYRLISEGVDAVRQLGRESAISARTTVQSANYSYLRATVASAHALGLDGISFLAADVTSQAFNRSLIWPVDRQMKVALTSQQTFELNIELEHLITEYSHDIASGFIRENPDKLRRIARHFRACLGEVSREAPICNAPWVSAVIEVNGDVRPCFFHNPVGNVDGISLMQVLNGERALEFRQNLDIKNNAICQQCVCSLNFQGQ
jgi:MoaA/NifB/PqqE/SkfB family radical SAM enzyme